MMTASAWIFDVSEQDLQRLLEQSHQQPVLVDFWADWCQPCQQLAPLLEKLVAEYQGKLLLARVNADTEQRLAQQFGVRSLPTLKLLVKGQLVTELSGMQSEAALREWLLPHLDPEAAEASQLEVFLQQARSALAAGQVAQVIPVLQQLLQERPQAHKARALLAECLLADGQQTAAVSLLAEVTEEVEEFKPLKARFALLEKPELDEAQTPLAELADAVATQDVTAEQLYLYGLSAAAAGEFRASLDALLRLLAEHSDFRDGIARSALLEVFACLPKGDPVASEYRRRMFNHLH